MKTFKEFILEATQDATYVIRYNVYNNSNPSVPPHFVFRGEDSVKTSSLEEAKKIITDRVKKSTRFKPNYEIKLVRFYISHPPVGNALGKMEEIK